MKRIYYVFVITKSKPIMLVRTFDKALAEKVSGHENTALVDFDVRHVDKITEELKVKTYNKRVDVFSSKVELVK